MNNFLSVKYLYLIFFCKFYSIFCILSSNKIEPLFNSVS